MTDISREGSLKYLGGMDVRFIRSGDKRSHVKMIERYALRALYHFCIINRSKTRPYIGFRVFHYAFRSTQTAQDNRITIKILRPCSI